MYLGEGGSSCDSCILVNVMIQVFSLSFFSSFNGVVFACPTRSLHGHTLVKKSKWSCFLESPPIHQHPPPLSTTTTHLPRSSCHPLPDAMPPHLVVHTATSRSTLPAAIPSQVPGTPPWAQQVPTPSPAPCLRHIVQ